MGQALEIYNKLGNKTATKYVKIFPIFGSKGVKYCKENGYVFSLRINSRTHFGNPFSSVEKLLATQDLIRAKDTKDSVVKYIHWVLNGTDTRAEWIRDVLESGVLKGKVIIYYKELGEPSHATALSYLINVHF